MANKTENFAEDIRKDQHALDTRAGLRSQEKIPVYLVWSPDDEKSFRGNKPLPYPKVELVSINEVRFFLERGKMHHVPISVAVVLANAGKIPWDVIPDDLGGEDKANYLAHLAEQEQERKDRYAGIGDGHVASIGSVVSNA